MMWLPFVIAAMVGGAVRLLLMSRLNSTGFPWGTLMVNLCGSFAAGVAEAHFAGAWRTVAVTGLLGAFTTFSSFAAETRQLLEERGGPSAAAFLAATSIGAVIAAWVGLGL